MQCLQALLEVLLLLALAHKSWAFTVCVISSAPGFTNCDPATDPATWTGYDLDNWRWVAAGLRWQEGGPEAAGAPVESGNFTLSCQPPLWDGMMLRLVNDSQYSSCAAAIGLISITSPRLQLGVQFTTRNFRGSISVLVRNDGVATYSAWGFLRPFRWTLWLAFLLTLLGLPLLLWLIETFLSSSGVVLLGWSTLDHLQSAVFLTALTVFNLRAFPATQLPAQVVVVVWCALVLVVVSNYTANLVSWLSTTTNVEALSSLEQLVGLPVMATPIYVPYLVSAGLPQAQPNPMVGADRLDYIHRQLASGAIAAYVADTSVLDYVQRLYDPLCLFKIMKEQFLPVGYGWAFHRLFPADVIDRVDQQLMLAEQKGVLAKLQSIYVYSSDACAAVAAVRAEKPVTFSQLRGLWIILGSVMCFVFLWSSGTMWRHVRHHMRQLRAQDLDVHLADLEALEATEVSVVYNSPAWLSDGPSLQAALLAAAAAASAAAAHPASLATSRAPSPTSAFYPDVYSPTSPTSPNSASSRASPSLSLYAAAPPALDSDRDSSPRPSFRRPSFGEPRGSRLHTLKRAMSRIFVTIPVLDGAGGSGDGGDGGGGFGGGGSSHHTARASSGRPDSAHSPYCSSSPRFSAAHSVFPGCSSPRASFTTYDALTASGRRPSFGPTSFSNNSPRLHQFDDGMPVLLPLSRTSAVRRGSRSERNSFEQQPPPPPPPPPPQPGGSPPLDHGGSPLHHGGSSAAVSMMRLGSDDAPWTYMSEDCSYHPVPRAAHNEFQRLHDSQQLYDSQQSSAFQSFPMAITKGTPGNFPPRHAAAGLPRRSSFSFTEVPPAPEAGRGRRRRVGRGRVTSR